MSAEVLAFPERRTKPLAHPRIRPPLPRRDMQRWECAACGAMLMEVQLRKGQIRVKCRCNAWNSMVAL